MCVSLLFLVAFLDTSDATAVTKLNPSNCPGSGGIDVILKGEEMGVDDLKPKAVVGSTACSRTVWVLDSALICHGFQRRRHSLFSS